MVGSRKGKIEYRLSPRRRTAISTCSPDVAACRTQGGRQGLLFQLVEQDPELLPKIGIRAADAVCDLDAEHPPLFRALRPDETSAEAVLGEACRSYRSFGYLWNLCRRYRFYGTTRRFATAVWRLIFSPPLMAVSAGFRRAFPLPPDFRIWVSMPPFGVFHGQFFFLRSSSCRRISSRSSVMANPEARSMT